MHFLLNLQLLFHRTTRCHVTAHIVTLQHRSILIEYHKAECLFKVNLSKVSRLRREVRGKRILSNVLFLNYICAITPVDNLFIRFCFMCIFFLDLFGMANDDIDLIESLKFMLEDQLYVKTRN